VKPLALLSLIGLAAAGDSYVPTLGYAPPNGPARGVPSRHGAPFCNRCGGRMHDDGGQDACKSGSRGCPKPRRRGAR